MSHAAGDSTPHAPSSPGPLGERSVRPEAASPLQLTTLGGMVLAAGSPEEGATPLLGPGKPLALLTYLACSPQRSAGRDHLVDLLWADTDPDAARHTLRQTMWYLRQRLGKVALRVAREDGHVTLTIEVRSDRDAFLTACESGSFEQAVALYTGAFLPSFGAPGAAEFEHWADLERDRLRFLFLRAAEHVVRQQLAAARPRDALALARRVRDAHPDRERGWRLVLEAHLSGSDAASAEMDAAALERLIAERDREPEPATRRMLALVRETPSAPEPAAGPTQLVAELVGREREFSHIVAAWDAACQGPGQHVQVRAPAGVGKTRLLNDVARRLRTTGARVVTIRARPGDRAIPSAFAADLATAVAALPGAPGVSPETARTLVGLNPTLSSRFSVPADRSVGPEAVRRRSHALRDLLAAVADESPLALLADDVHWADADSLRLLQTMIDHITDERVLLVTTTRPVPGGTPAGEATERLELMPLDATQLGVVLTSLGTLPEAPWAAPLPAALREASGGVPLLALETLQLALDRKVLERAEGAWRCPDPAALTEMLREGSALRRRIASLERQPSYLLLLLAADGTALGTDLLAAASGYSVDAVVQALDGMERAGLVMRTASAWEPAHDAIADSGLELAAPESCRTAHAALGRALCADEAAEPERLWRAAHHLAAAGAEVELGAVFPRWAAAVRRRGDRRPNRDLCRELLGTAVTPTRLAALVRALPVSHRTGLYSPARMGAAAGVALTLVVGTAALLLRPPAQPPDATLLLTVAEATGSRSAYTIPLSLADWTGGSPINVTARDRVNAAAVPTAAYHSEPSLSDHRWAFDSVTTDSGEIDLFVRDANGTVTRLTETPGDDTSPRWSPDGRKIAFTTTRWSPSRWNDLAVLDLETGQVTEVAAGLEECHGNHAWSPSGTRIAYQRSNCFLGDDYLCVVGPDGTGQHCVPIRPDHRVSVLGWYDSRRLIVQRDSGNAAHLGLLTLDDNTFRPITRASGHLSVSPDGRWIACHCRRGRNTERTWYVFPTDHPEAARTLRLPSSGSPTIVLSWTNLREPPPYLATLRVDPRAESLPVGVPHRLRAIGRDQRGERIMVPQLRWTVNSDAASVEETTGIVLARHPGMVTIRTSAGGWRRAEITLPAVAATHRTIVLEDWSKGLSSRWVSFGDPRPDVTTGPGGGPAFWTRGDGWFASGAYTRRAFQARRGLGAEALWSTPVIGPRQQQNILSWISTETALENWDHVTGNPPATPTLSDCSVAYAPGDGVPTEPYIVPPGTIRTPIDPIANSGAWYRVRVQIFPDGRCGIAVSGKPVWISDHTMPASGTWRLFLQGNSVGTKMLVGPLEVWEGVRTDIDWTRAGDR